MSFKSALLKFLLFVPVALQASVAEPDNDAFLHELESAKYAMTLKYAPAEWKNGYLQWDSAIAYEEAKAKLIENRPSTLRGYQKIFRDFLKSTQDYHVNALFCSTELSFIPIKVREAQGHYYISGVEWDSAPIIQAVYFEYDELDFEAMMEELSRCAIGDEIVAVNGVPVAEIIESLIDEELSGDRTPTGYSLASKMLFLRNGKFGHTTPQGMLSLTVLPKGRGAPVAITVPWIHVKEWVKDTIAKDLMPKSMKFWDRVEKRLVKDYSAEIAKSYLENPIDTCKRTLFSEEEGIDMREKAFLPELGKVVWSSREDFYIYAYIYRNAQGKQIGYIHIPHFLQFGLTADVFINQYVEILNKFNQETQGLVIDINDNPGGNFFYMLAILSTLTDKPLVLPTQTEILIQQDVLGLAQMYNEFRLEQELDLEDVDSDGKDIDDENTLSGYVIDDATIKKMMDHCLTIVNLWESGERKTPELHMFGFDVVVPHPRAQYNKPILLLINELDFSCGDLFPAIMQDNNRAVLFGKKTAGAGGYVNGYPATSQFGVSSFMMTGSLCRRPGGQVLENLGVEPDISYELTARDMQTNYSEYVRAVNQEMNRLIRK